MANIDALFVAACTFEAPEFLVKSKCKVEAFFRPFVPNKKDHWQIFNDDAQIIILLHCVDYSLNHMISLDDQMEN